MTMKESCTLILKSEAILSRERNIFEHDASLACSTVSPCFSVSPWETILVPRHVTRRFHVRQALHQPRCGQTSFACTCDTKAQRESETREAACLRVPIGLSARASPIDMRSKPVSDWRNPLQTVTRAQTDRSVKTTLHESGKDV